MIGDLVARFFLGGALVSLFALVGDLFEPKTFGGLFGAAPSVALATLALSVRAHGTAYGATEARSMIIGAIALLAYASTVSAFLHRRRARIAPAVLGGLLVWFVAVAIGGVPMVVGR
jgi:hypothetical protein